MTARFIQKTKSLFIVMLAVLSLAPTVVVAADDIFISSPVSGTVVIPGQVVQVVVNQRAGLQKAYFDQSFGVLPSPIYDSQEVMSIDPYVIKIVISKVVSAGDYPLVAFGLRRGGGGAALSKAVKLRVAANIPARIEFWAKYLELRFPGDSVRPLIEAYDATGRRSVVTDADVTFEVVNPAVAQITNGMLLGVARGTTQLLAKVGTLEAVSEVEVLQPSRRGDLNGDDIVDVVDVNILKGSLVSPFVGPTDLRDLNKDGRVDALDQSVLMTLCTNPQCVSKTP